MVTLPPERVLSRPTVIVIPLCLSAVLSARISQKRHVQTSQSFLYLFPVAVIWSSSDNSAINYVGLFQVLWLTLRSDVMGQIQMQAIANYSW